MKQYRDFDLLKQVDFGGILPKMPANRHLKNAFRTARHQVIADRIAAVPTNTAKDRNPS